MADFTQEELKRAIEAIIFASERPLGLDRLGKIFPQVSKQTLRSALEGLIKDYQGRGIEIKEVAEGFRFQTAADLKDLVIQARQATPTKLSRAAMETLAIIAYRQPITRAEIEEIRGVDSSGPLKALLERGLIKVVGRKDVLGRPLLYGTTTYFLEVFELKSLSELPNLKEIEDLERPGDSDLAPLFKVEKA
ncbi:SMC-Scp complex subunit ScpB [Thermosulfuriphilus sp.]